MQISARTEHDVAVLELRGELDGKTAPETQEAILQQAQPNCKMILDLSEMTYMSSAGLRVLLLVYRRVNANNGRVALVGLSEEIRETMEMTGFLAHFQTYPTLRAGLEALVQ